MTIKSRCRELIEIGDKLFSARGSLMSLWQDIAENFYPERADFTSARAIGDDFASHLMTGYAPLQHRELTDQLAAMLRPREKLWAKLTATNAEINEDTTARQWLEWASERQRQAMYARGAQFLRATKMGDADFVAFGQAAILPSLNPTRDGLLYRNFHLRDTAWCEGPDGAINAVHRREKRYARDLVKLFPKTASADLVKLASKEPYTEVECRHIVVPADQYDDQANERFPFRSFYIDVLHDTELEDVPQKRIGYVIPRWRIGAFGQYATSPCTMIGLPDARLLNQMTVALLEASEKAVTPPMIATLEAVRSDMQLFAGGHTWVDREYDERNGEALRPIPQDFRGIAHGQKMLEDVRELLKQQFFLHKINLPPVEGGEMTAYETRKRYEEYIRGALPLFEPMEVEYNGAVSEETFAILVENNAFGPPEGMPEVLRGADVRFEFESPLQATAKRAKAQSFQEALQILTAAMQIDQKAVLEVDTQKAVRDALDGVDVPADWLRDPEKVQELVAAAQQAQAEQLQSMEAGQVAEMAGRAAPMVKALSQ